MPSNARYELIRKIADGGMAAIYLGIQHGAASFERPVVIKAIRADRLTDASFRNALIDEAQIGMALNHSNIVQVLDLGESGGRYFLILELVDGWDLAQVLKRSAAVKFPLPVPLALHITAEVCRALGYAHAKTRRGKPLNIIHRDVSPHNVLLSEHGEVKLTDFGIATASERLEHTATGLIKGKVGFMSPEQASGQPLGPPSDLFSLGAMLYLMVTGARPFDSETELETLLRTKESRYVPPREIQPSLSNEVTELIKRSLQKNPKQRFETAEQMLEAVEKVERGLEPAGATELRRWLGELSNRDHDVPVTKLTAPPLEVGDDDIVSQSGLVLSEVMPVQVSGSVAVGTPPPAKPSVLRSALFLGFLAGATAAVAFGVWTSRGSAPPLASNPGSASPPPRAAIPAVAVPPTPGAALSATAVDAGSPDAGSVLAARAARVDAGPALPVAVSPPPRVPPETTPAPAKQPRTVAASEKPLADGEDPVVSISVTSSPPGAQVSVENRPFGATPIKIRVRSGLAYDVSFNLAGYQLAKQHLFVSHRKNQSLSVVLKRQ